MAPSSGHLLVPMAMRVLRHISKKTSTLIRSKLSSLQSAKSELQPIYVRNTSRQPIHPAAYRRQSNRRWFATHSTVNANFRRFTSSSHSGVKYHRASFPKSAVGAAVGRLTTRAPFASTLRPNLTGGALPRTAGGYSIGAGRVGGVRHFSHTPAAPAEIINNVSAAVRAFWLAGHRAQFDGVDGRFGQKRFKAMTLLQDQAGRKMRSIPRATPGSHVDFHLSPTITAMSPLGICLDSSTGLSTGQTLNSEGLLNGMAVDFAHAVKDLGTILQDLQRLSVLGDLPLSMPERSLVRVQFPSCDLKTVERLCDEVGVRRGVIRQDEDFDAYGCVDLPLLFPFAPSTTETVSFSSLTEKKGQDHVKRDEIEWLHMMSSGQTKTKNSAGFSECSDTGYQLEGTNSGVEYHRALTASGYSSLHTSSQFDENADLSTEPVRYAAAQSASDYEGLEGIYRFLELCDNARR